MIKIRDFYTKSTLVGFTQPVTELQQKGIDDAQELIAYCARVSNPDNQFNTETSEKLIKYLLISYLYFFIISSLRFKLKKALKD